MLMNVLFFFAVAPKSVEMVNHAPEALITLKEKDQTELECVVKEARPSASIVWYKNGKVLRLGKNNFLLFLFSPPF